MLQHEGYIVENISMLKIKMAADLSIVVTCL